MNLFWQTGLVERIGEEEGVLKCTFMPGSPDEKVVKLTEPIADHNKGMLLAVNLLSDTEYGVLSWER